MRQGVGRPPRGVHVETRGQIDPMEKMFESLGIGLVVAVCVILVLLTAYFQAWRSGADYPRWVPCPACSAEWS